MSKKILIVEDTPDLLQSILEFLIMEGYETIGCLSGKEALEKLSASKPDLIITDLSMPDMDGFQLIERIKEIKHLDIIPIAIFSARPAQENQAKALSFGVTKYIKKPCTPEELLASIEELLKEN
jgi:DNA-binding response OmpR family regulator